MSLHPAVVVLAAALSSACAAPPRAAVDLEAERARLGAADERYTAVMNAGDVEGIVSLYAEDATRWSPDGPATSGPEAMRAFAERVASMPGFALTARRLRLDVSAGGDMGYTVNELELTVKGEDGEPDVERLRDVHFWRKGPGGVWRIVEDVWQVLP